MPVPATLSGALPSGARLAAELAPQLAGAVAFDDLSLDRAATDFGRVVRRRPRLVVRPSVADDVLTTVRFARARGLALAMQGAAHCQGGQSLSEGGLVLDLRGLRRITAVDRANGWFECEAGATWHEVMTATRVHAAVPPVLTTNLATTVGGTHAVGGLGRRSFRRGAQADNALGLEVITGAGERLWCDRQQNRDLFRHTLCGLGQLGIITRVRHRLHPEERPGAGVRAVYRHASPLLRDGGWLAARSEVSSLIARVDHGRGRWWYRLWIGLEAGTSSRPLLAGLGATYARPWLPGAVQTIDPRASTWREANGAALRCPGMDMIVPASEAAAYLDATLASIPVALRPRFAVSLLFLDRRRLGCPLLVTPSVDELVLVTLSPAVPESDLGQVLEIVDRATRLGNRSGGKRYLAGWISYRRADWQHHYRGLLETLHDLKRRHDPDGIMSPDLIQYAAERPET
jgi:cytokinin dehydrogenase